MCYDISFKANVPELQDYFPDLRLDGQLPLDFAPMDHIMGHAYPLHPIVFRTKEGQLLCRLMEWGVIPFYTKDEKTFARQRPSMLNARAERILDDPKSSWSKIQQRRCLIPVTGIYEHRGIAGWKKKVPYFVSLPDQPVFFLPGLYGHLSFFILNDYLIRPHSRKGLAWR